MRKFDTFATEMIPIRLIISIIVMAAIAMMIAVGYQNLSIILAENQVRNECSALEAELYTMVGSGITRDVDDIGASDGTMRTHTFTLPDSLIYLSFGVDPDTNNDGKLNTGLTENGSVIFYRVSEGSKQVIWFQDNRIKFREGLYNLTYNKWVINGKGQGLIITGGGKTTLTFELVEKNNVQYILILANDNIEPVGS